MQRFGCAAPTSTLTALMAAARRQHPVHLPVWEPPHGSRVPALRAAHAGLAGGTRQPAAERRRRRLSGARPDMAGGAIGSGPGSHAGPCAPTHWHPLASPAETSSCAAPLPQSRSSRRGTAPRPPTWLPRWGRPAPPGRRSCGRCWAAGPRRSWRRWTRPSACRACWSGASWRATACERRQPGQRGAADVLQQSAGCARRVGYGREGRACAGCQPGVQPYLGATAALPILPVMPSLSSALGARKSWFRQGVYSGRVITWHGCGSAETWPLGKWAQPEKRLKLGMSRARTRYDGGCMLDMLFGENQDQTTASMR